MVNKIVEVMVDLETLATTPDAHILSIGACTMDTLQTFYSVPGLGEQGRAINDDTIDWWLKQSKEARKESFIESKDGVTLEKTLKDFAFWFKSVGATRIWANSPSFDCVIIEDACRQYGIKVPWQFWLTQDQRTMVKLATKVFGEDFEPDRHGTHHNALDDCIFQAQWMNTIEDKFHELKRKVDK